MPEFNILKFSNNQMIFKEGWTGTSAFIVKQGAVKIIKEKEEKTVHVATLKKGEVFGEIAIFSNTKRTTTAMADGYTELVEVKADTLNQELKKSSPILQAILTCLIKRLVRVTDNIREDETLNLVTRIANIIEIYLNSKLDTVDAKKSIPTDIFIEKRYLIDRIKGIVDVKIMDIEKVVRLLKTINLIAQEKLGNKIFIRIFNPQYFHEKVTTFIADNKKIAELDNIAYSTYLDLIDLAKITDSTQEQLKNGFIKEDFPAELILFRQEEIKKWLEEVGTDYFSEQRKVIRKKKLDQITVLEELSEIGNFNLKRVCGQLSFDNILQITKALSSQMAEKVGKLLSTKNLAFLREEMKYFDDIDEDEKEAIEDKYIDIINAILKEK